MKLKIWSEEEARTGDKNQLFLRLECSGGEDIALVVTNITGEQIPGGTLMFFDNDMRIVICPDSISHDVPLKTDAFGELLIISLDQYKEKKSHELQQQFFHKMISEQMKHEEKTENLH